jgi:glycosyltransferase involved in cell wall biosynthesis
MTILGLFLNPELRTGGHKRYMELLGGLAGRDHTVHLLVASEAVPTPNGVHTVPISVGESLAVVHSTAKRWQIGVRRSSARILDLRPVPEIVLIFGETTYPAARTAAELLRVPVVISIRSNMIDELAALGSHVGPRPLAPLLGPIERILILARERSIARDASRIVFQSEYDRSRFLSRQPRSGRAAVRAPDVGRAVGDGKYDRVAAKTEVVPNSVSASWFNPRYRDANESTKLKRLVFVGALNRRKGIMILLEALVRSSRPLKLDVVGFGEQEELARGFVARNGLENTVTFRGRVAEAIPFIAAADLLVVPSLVESFPNVLLEALHCGTPAVGSRVGGIPEILGDHRLLLEPGDADSMARTLASLYDDPRAYQTVKRVCAARRPRFEFDWVARFERVLQTAATES